MFLTFLRNRVQVLTRTRRYIIQCLHAVYTTLIFKTAGRDCCVRGRSRKIWGWILNLIYVGFADFKSGGIAAQNPNDRHLLVSSKVQHFCGKIVQILYPLPIISTRIASIYLFVVFNCTAIPFAAFLFSLLFEYFCRRICSKVHLYHM